MFEPRSGQTSGAFYFCPKSYLDQKYTFLYISVKGLKQSKVNAHSFL